MDTRTRILETAEGLFATKGYAGTSIREITRDAGVNVAAIHYHFGSKEALLRGVTDRIVRPLNERRFQLLDEALRRSDPAPIEDLLVAFIRPDVETLQELQQRGPTVAHFIGRTYADQTPWIQEMISEQFAETRTRFFSAIAASLPQLPPAEIAWRMAKVAALVVHLFATWPPAAMTDQQAEATIERHVAFLAPALSAPIPTSSTGGASN